MHRGAEPHMLHHARRCGARTRSGRPCRSPAVHGRPRCPDAWVRSRRWGLEGERNGNYRHGLYTKETQTRLRAMRDLRREVKDLTRKLRGGVRSGIQAGRAAVTEVATLFFVSNFG